MGGEIETDGANYLHCVSMLPHWHARSSVFRDCPGRHKRADKNHKEKLRGVYAQISYRVASFFVCTENGSAPKIFGYQAVLYLDRYRTRLCDMPSAEPIAKGSGHA